jgi:hypothetical protein
MVDESDLCSYDLLNHYYLDSVCYRQAWRLSAMSYTLSDRFVFQLSNKAAQTSAAFSLYDIILHIQSFQAINIRINYEYSESPWADC